jgi:hypothetical protein
MMYASRMGTEGPKGTDWRAEFQQLNKKNSSSPSEPAGSASRGLQRRRHERFRPEEARVSVYQGGLLASIGVGRENLARIPVDLSEGGARIALHERLKPGTKVQVRIAIDKFGDAIEAAGVVRWCFESRTQPGDFHAGIMFTDLEPSTKRLIAAMRDWFTSSKCLKVRAARAREGDGGQTLQFPKG